MVATGSIDVAAELKR